MRVLAMIPARLGSKRIPKKNLRLLDGKPLLIYPIELAKEAGGYLFQLVDVLPKPYSSGQWTSGWFASLIIVNRPFTMSHFSGFDEIWLNTESAELKSAAEKSGVQVHLRPPHLAVVKKSKYEKNIAKT